MSRLLVGFMGLVLMAAMAGCLITKQIEGQLQLRQMELVK